MKKLFILSYCLICAACHHSDILLVREFVFGKEIPENITNPECDIVKDGVYIIQVLDNGVLAQLVSYFQANNTTYTDYFENPGNSDIFYIPVKKENLANMYDGKAIGTDVCFKRDGVYTYTDVMGGKRTIQKLKSVDKYITNPEYLSKPE